MEIWKTILLGIIVFFGGLVGSIIINLLHIRQKFKHIKNVEKREDIHNYKQKIETSKFIAIYLFLLLNIIIIYAMIMMWIFQDLSCLSVLITDIAAQVLLYAIYCLKAYKAKKSEEDLKFEREKYLGTLGNILKASAECDECVPTTTGSIELFNANGDNTVGEFYE